MDFLANINLMGLGELQNATIQNLSAAPSGSSKPGRLYFNTTDHTLYVYNGTDWKDALKQGEYTFQNGIEALTGADIGKVQLKIASGANAGNVTLTADSNGLAASVAEASTSAKGIIEIADADEISAGTATDKAVTPKQLADGLSTKVTANAAITGATKCKITYDSKGLVTSGADLAASDIPNLSLSKITDVTATATEVNVLDGITATTTELNYVGGVTSSIQDQLNSKIGLTGLSIASDSTDYLEYDNTEGEFSAKVDTVVTASSTNLVTSGAVDSAIADFITASSTDTLTNKTFDANGIGNSISNLEVDDFALNVITTSIGGTGSDDVIPTEKAVRDAIKSAVASGVRYIGSVDLDQSGLAGITVPAYKGDLYLVTGDTVTISGVEWNAGDYLIVNKDVASGSVTASDVEKIDNTESTDIVKLDATQTLTNKTIDADDNTISDLTTSNLKSGVLQTAVRADGTATDTAIPSEKAVRDLVAGMVTETGTQTLTNKTIDADDNTISDLELDNFKSGVVVTSIGTTGSGGTASDSHVATELAVATALASTAKVYTETNGALPVSSGGECTWTVTHNLGSNIGIHVYNASTGEEIGCNKAITSATVATVTLLATADITAGTYKVVVIGN